MEGVAGRAGREGEAAERRVLQVQGGDRKRVTGEEQAVERRDEGVWGLDKGNEAGRRGCRDAEAGMERWRDAEPDKEAGGMLVQVEGTVRMLG